METRTTTNLKKQTIKKTLIKQIWRFCVVGGLAFVIDAGLLYLLKEFFHIYYLIANVISFSVSTIYNYYASVEWVFEASDEKKKNKKYTFLFAVFSLAGLGLNQICMYLFVSKLDIYYMAAKVLSTCVVMYFNFVTRKKMYN